MHHLQKVSVVSIGINFTIPGDFLLELSYSQDFQKNMNSDFDQDQVNNCLEEEGVS